MIYLNNYLRDVFGFEQKIIKDKNAGTFSEMDCAIFADYPPGFSSESCTILCASFTEILRMRNSNFKESFSQNLNQKQRISVMRFHPCWIAVMSWHPKRNFTALLKGYLLIMMQWCEECEVLDAECLGNSLSAKITFANSVALRNIIWLALRVSSEFFWHISEFMCSSRCCHEYSHNGSCRV